VCGLPFNQKKQYTMKNTAMLPPRFSVVPIDSVRNYVRPFGLTFENLIEYKRLNKKVYQGVSAFKKMFVILDMNNPDHARLNELSGLVTPLIARLVSRRSIWTEVERGIALNFF
jgi:hypothetical protein